MITIETYNPGMATQWDDTVRASRNGTFLHLRQYMDYHSDRFADCSLLARDAAGRIIAVLPAHHAGDTVASHRGLSYGGWLMTPRADAEAMMEIWPLMADHYRACGYKTLVYKPSPHIFHKYPAEEDLYALFRAGGRLESTLISSVVDNTAPLGFDMAARQSVRKAARAGVAVGESDNWAGFWNILAALLMERHNARPVHTLAEIQLLHSRFPDNIRLFTATLDGRIVAGVVIYASDTCAHSQYAATTAEGRALRALPLLYSHIMERYAALRYFDFGTSNEDGGRILNTGLIRQKCGFGARAVIYPTFTQQL